MRWTKSGNNHLATSWVGDTQVIYLVEEQNSLLSGAPEWVIHRKVMAHSGIVGIQSELGKAQRIAEYDEGQLQARGF